jgi:pimeloyl-ACP methyl ester carboxylesterase
VASQLAALVLGSEAAAAAADTLTVVVGHSMGCLAAAALAAARDPSTTVLVLVSPAILVPANAAQAPRRPGAAVAAPWAAAEVRVAGGPVRLAQWWRAGVAAALLRLGLPLLLALLPPLLRSLAYSEAFWRKGLASAVGPEAPKTATALPGGTAAASAAERPRERPPSATMVRAYRWPSLCRGWSVGLTRFTAAALAEASAAKSSAEGSSGGSNSAGSSSSSTESRSQGSGSALSELEAAVGRGLAVLVLHGARDAIIPAANSQRLAARLSAAAGARSASAISESAARASEPPPPCGLVRVVEFAGSGHLPHEEEPEALAEAVAAFVAEARRDES